MKCGLVAVIRVLGLTVCPKTLVTSSQPILRNITERNVSATLWETPEISYDHVSYTSDNHV